MASSWVKLLVLCKGGHHVSKAGDQVSSKSRGKAAPRQPSRDAEKDNNSCNNNNNRCNNNSCSNNDVAIPIGANDKKVRHSKNKCICLFFGGAVFFDDDDDDDDVDVDDDKDEDNQLFKKTRAKNTNELECQPLPPRKINLGRAEALKMAFSAFQAKWFEILFDEVNANLTKTILTCYTEPFPSFLGRDVNLF